MKNLISMTDFVLEQRKTYNGDFEDLADLYLRYANFLKQPLELCMFVPCDENRNVLQEPKLDYEPVAFWNAGEIDEKHNELYGEYQQAKERCLFEGFDSAEKCQKKNYFEFENDFGQDVRIYTVEDLVYHDLVTLTPTAIKQIGL